MTSFDAVSRLLSDVGATPSSRKAVGGDVVTADTEALSVDDVDRLLVDGAAEPLLVGYHPIPVLIRQRWWHRPEGRDDYRPASPAAAAVFDARRTRLRAAAQAATESGARRSGTRGR